MFRRFLSVFILLALMFSVCTSTVFADTESNLESRAQSYKAGDINGDNIVELKDLVALAQYVAKWKNPTVNKQLVDVNLDGKTDFSDVTDLARYYTGWKNIAIKGDGYMNFSSASYTLKEIKTSLKLNSRATFDSDALRMEWSASGFTVQGQFKENFTLTNVVTSGEILLYAILDDDFDNPVQIRTRGGTVTALTNIKPGFHTIQILKATEAAAGIMSIGGISYNGAIFTAPAEKELRIQFIGDSITSASGLYTASAEPYSLLRNDITKGYAYKVAKHFNADFSIVSVSGGTVCTNTPSMQDYYQKTFFAKNGEYDFNTEPEPDLVIVALGANDTPSYITGSRAPLTQGIKDMLTLVRSKNPNAAILWAYGMMDTRIDTVYKQAVQNFAKTDGNTYYTLINRNDCTGLGGHPTPNGHTLNAKEYINFIEKNIW